jgi:hypothetical protein
MLPWALLGSMLIAADICRAPGSRLRGEFVVFIMLSALAFGNRALSDMRVIEMRDTLIPALVPGVALLVAAAVTFRAAGSRLRRGLIAAVIAGAAYGYGAAMFANGLFDKTPTQFFESRVMDKRILFSLGGADMQPPGFVLGPDRVLPFDLRKFGKEVLLRAWGPVAQDRWEAHLPWGMYEYVGPSTRICLDYHAGAFSIPWYEIKSCRKERRECVKDPDCKAWLDDMQERLSLPPPIVKRG